MKMPPNAQTTSTEQSLSSGPADMPDRGGSKPNAQTTSSQVTMGRQENPVAQLGARPGMGDVQSTSTKASLDRKSSNPYDKLSATKPQVSLPGGRK